ncbi:hypothetical protein M8818_003610 [Zalaria obscura]|uniref:Uncharacterized protein n=1 Tax=Zalaria obscura TaxID=2024903 RepID=A0ACC3SDT4_9PEZI
MEAHRTGYVVYASLHVVGERILARLLPYPPALCAAPRIELSGFPKRSMVRFTDRLAPVVNEVDQFEEKDSLFACMNYTGAGLTTVTQPDHTQQSLNTS